MVTYTKTSPWQYTYRYHHGNVSSCPHQAAPKPETSTATDNQKQNKITVEVCLHVYSPVKPSPLTLCLNYRIHHFGKPLASIQNSNSLYTHDMVSCSSPLNKILTYRYRTVILQTILLLGIHSRFT